MKHLSKILIISACLAIAACSGTKLLYDQAKNPAQYAKAVLLHHNAVANEGAKLLSDPAVSAKTKEAIRSAYRSTVCDKSETGAVSTCTKGPAYVLDNAVRSYETVSSAKTEAELQTALESVVSLLTNLINAIRGGG